MLFQSGMRRLYLCGEHVYIANQALVGVGDRQALWTPVTPEQEHEEFQARMKALRDSGVTDL